MNYNSTGDLVWLPQGTMLVSRPKWDLPDVKILEKPQAAIVLDTHPENHLKQVYVSGGYWWVDESEIKEFGVTENVD